MPRRKDITEAQAPAEALGVLGGSSGREDRIDLPDGDHGQQRSQITSNLTQQPGLKSRYKTFAPMPGSRLPGQQQTPPQRVMAQATELAPQQQSLRVQ